MAKKHKPGSAPSAPTSSTGGSPPWERTPKVALRTS